MPSPIWFILPGVFLCLIGLGLAGWRNDVAEPPARRLAGIPANLVALMRGRRRAGLHGWIGLKVLFLGIIAILTGIALP